MQKIYSLAAFILLSMPGVVAKAQGSFRAGYIVRPSGDTLRGQVGYHDARRNATVCEFIPATGSSVERLGPAELRGYGIWHEEAYRALQAPRRDSAGQARASQLVFLEIIAAGTPASLYRRRISGEDTRYYLQKSPDAPVRELLVKKQVVEEGTRKYTQDVLVYRGVMTEEFADCPSVLLSLASVSFRLADLTRAVQRYNTCRQPGSSTAAAYHAPLHIGVDLLLGAQRSKMLVFGDNSAASGHYNSGVVPDVGLGLWIGSQALRDKLQARVEAHYVSQKYEDEFQHVGSIVSPFATYTSQVHFKTTYLRLPILVRYSPLVGRVRPFIEAGVSVNPLLQLTQEIRTRNNSTATYGDWKPVYDANNLHHVEYGFLAGAGLQVVGPGRHAVSLLGRYEASNGFLNTPLNTNKFRRYSLSVAVGLSKQR
jgi:hypothetical protein